MSIAAIEFKSANSCAPIDYAGLRTNDLAGPARQRFRDLIHLYISNMDEGHARVKMDEVTILSGTCGWQQAGSTTLLSATQIA